MSSNLTSNRTKEWYYFSHEVAIHVENYTVPQYGDYPHDALTNYSIQDIKVALEKYVRRIGTNSRGQVEAVRDCKKIAHYACVLNSLLQKDQPTKE